MTDSPQSNERICALLEELVAWAKVTGYRHAREALSDTLQTQTYRKIYQASTGESSREVADQVGVSGKTVRRVWGLGSRLGLMRESTEVAGRYVRSFDLEDFELPPPTDE